MACRDGELCRRKSSALAVVAPAQVAGGPDRSPIAPGAAIETVFERKAYGAIAPPAGQSVSPSRCSFIPKNSTGSWPGVWRVPISVQTPSFTTAV